MAWPPAEPWWSAGLARGIDSAALRGALRAGGTVAAVLGNGTGCDLPTGKSIPI